MNGFTIAALQKNWRWLGGLAGMFLVALGFGFKTPAQQFASLRTEIAARDARLVIVEEDQTAIRVYLRAIVIAQCLDRPRRETSIMGLPCEKLLAGQPLIPDRVPVSVLR